MTTIYSPTNAFAVFVKAAGLVVSFNGGRGLLSSGSIASVSSSAISLTANSTNYVYLDLNTGTVTNSTSAFPALNAFPMAIAVTDSISITSLTDVRPDVQSSSSGVINFSNLASGTNTSAAMVVSTGASLKSSGTGTVSANQVVISSTAPGTPPAPLSSNLCPTGETPFMYGLNASSQYQTLASWNTTAAPPTPAGSLTFCWPFQYNDSGTSISPNRAFSVTHVAGAGGLTSATNADESAIMGIMQNTGTGQSFHQFLTFYGEADLSGTPTFGGHAGGEASVSVYRGNHTNAASSVTGGGGFWAFSGQYEHNGSSVPTTTGVYHAYMSSTGGSGNQSNQIVRGFDCAGAFAGTETNYLAACFVATLSQPRYPSGNYGLLVNDFSTNASDFNIISVGVNSAGTASGFNNFYGPVSTGNQNVHAATGYQFDCVGAVKVKAGAGVSLIDLFGSTSGHAGISVAAAAGTPNPLQLPITTSTATTSGVSQALVSDGASPQQLAYQWHAPVMSASGTVQTAGKVVFGSGSLVSGSPSTLTVTLTGNAVFTNSGSYVVTAINNTTAANSLKVTQSSGSSFVITGPNTLTDTVSWIATGA